MLPPLRPVRHSQCICQVAAGAESALPRPGHCTLRHNAPQSPSALWTTQTDQMFSPLREHDWTPSLLRNNQLLIHDPLFEEF